MKTEFKEQLREFPSPQSKTPGWYPDPLGSTAERFWDQAWLDIIRTPQLRLPGNFRDRGGARKTLGETLRIPPLVRKPAFELPSLKKDIRDQRAREKEQQRQSMIAEAKKDAFFLTPAGRARKAFERGHRIFQYELELGERDPILIPGAEGSPARSTADPVDILNSVTVEGWKLVTGTFFYVEVRNGAVGCYLFKRSKKRKQLTADPWKA